MNTTESLGLTYRLQPRTPRTPRISAGQRHRASLKNRAQSAHGGECNRAQNGGATGRCARFSGAMCAVASPFSHRPQPTPCFLTSSFTDRVRAVRAVRGSSHNTSLQGEAR
jgi:hypothetical protein